MTEKLTIGTVARSTGLPAKTIRFYERVGVIPAPARTDSGYRQYTPTDVRRLRLARRARQLGMPLAEVRLLVTRAFASECSTYADELLTRVASQRAEVGRRLAELNATLTDLDELEQHVRHAQARAAACSCKPGRLVMDCGFCPLIDDEGGSNHANE